MLIKQPDKIKHSIPKSEQSANTFFHFMNRYNFLKEIIKDKKLYPRYCEEDFSLLNLDFKQIRIAMKCFCDIPLHKVDPHRKAYGDYCIGLTKSWGIKNGLQPVIYYNPNCGISQSVKKSFDAAIRYSENDENIDEVAEIINTTLKYLKSINGKDLKTDKIKDFTDEKEWRFVPNLDNQTGFEEVIIDSKIINNIDIVESYNREIKKYDDYCLQFEYADIKYIFVKTSKQRDNLIKLILKCNEDDSVKYRLISCIKVWQEVRGDF